MKKKILVVILVILLAAAVGYIIYSSIAEKPKPVEVHVGWNDFQTIDGIVPKGAIIVASEETNLIIPGDRETKKKTGFITGGVVIVYSDTTFTSEGKVWIYIPEDYEFITMVNLFSSELVDKMSDLVGHKVDRVENFYFVGKP